MRTASQTPPHPRSLAPGILPPATLFICHCSRISQSNPIQNANYTTAYIFWQLSCKLIKQEKRGAYGKLSALSFKTHPTIEVQISRHPGSRGAFEWYCRILHCLFHCSTFCSQFCIDWLDSFICHWEKKLTWSSRTLHDILLPPESIPSEGL